MTLSQGTLDAQFGLRRIHFSDWVYEGERVSVYETEDAAALGEGPSVICVAHFDARDDDWVLVELPTVPPRHPATADAWAWLQSRTIQEMDIERRYQIASALVKIDATFNSWEGE